MTDPALPAPWVRRFLLEHLVGERNLSLNTQRSYRDMLTQLLPFVGEQIKKPVDRLLVTDLSAPRIRLFLAHLERTRRCGASTRNQRLGGMHALARFVGAHSPEHLEWCSQIRLIPCKKMLQQGRLHKTSAGYQLAPSALASRDPLPATPVQPAGNGNG